MNCTNKEATVKRFHYDATTSFGPISKASSLPTISPSAAKPWRGAHIQIYLQTMHNRTR